MVWQSPTVVRIVWDQATPVELTCLYQNKYLITCWRDLPTGTHTLTLGDHGPLDAVAHPSQNAVYTLTQDDTQQQATAHYELRIPLIIKTP